MKRRTLIAAGLSAVSSAAIGAETAAADGIEQALFASGADTAPVDTRLLAGRVAWAERDLEAARLAELERRLPGLIAAATATWEAADGTGREQAASLLSRTLSVVGLQQLRTSREPVASVAADRALRFAGEAGDPIAEAEARRVQATVLRRTGSSVAGEVMVTAADRLRSSTGLADPTSAGMYAKVTAAAAYTAAGRDDRGQAADLLEAARAAIAPFGDTPHLAEADLDVYVVSCDRVLGDFGAALHHAERVDLSRVPDAHETGRYWQEVAIAAYGRGRLDHAMTALAELDAAAPQYLRHRSWARDLVEDLLSTRAGGSNPLLRRLAGRMALT